MTMTQAVDKLNHRRDMLQAVPTSSWSDHLQHPSTGVPATMDFTYDGVYNTFTPNPYNAFPSVFTQTLCELELDTSIHKLFEGLPEILDETPALGRPAATGRPASSTPFFPSTPPAQGTRHSSVLPGSAPDVTFMTTVHNATPPAPRHGDRKGARGPRTGKGGGRRSAKIDAPKVPGTSRGSPKVLDAIVPSISIPAQPSVAHVACMLPKILSSTALSAVDPRAVKANEVHPVHPSIGLGPQAVLRMPKRSRGKEPPPQMANTRTQKTRYFDKVEHIVRERWRRDDMAGKFLALESLLPPSSKRDRSTIVEDSMTLVKSLQHRKEEALKRRTELKLATQSPGMKLNRIIQKIGSLAVIPIHGNAHTLQESPSSSSMVLSTKAGTKRPLEACAAVADGDRGQIPQVLSDCVKRFYVQSELAMRDIVIELICEQIPNFHSILLKSMETLGLEVIRCSITKTINKLICNITVRPFPYSASVNVSSISIMEGLSSAFQKV